MTGLRSTFPRIPLFTRVSSIRRQIFRRRTALLCISKLSEMARGEREQTRLLPRVNKMKYFWFLLSRLPTIRSRFSSARCGTTDSTMHLAKSNQQSISNLFGCPTRSSFFLSSSFLRFTSNRTRKSDLAFIIDSTQQPSDSERSLLFEVPLFLLSS